MDRFERAVGPLNHVTALGNVTLAGLDGLSMAVLRPSRSESFRVVASETFRVVPTCRRPRPGRGEEPAQIIFSLSRAPPARRETPCAGPRMAPDLRMVGSQRSPPDQQLHTMCRAPDGP